MNFFSCSAPSNALPSVTIRVISSTLLAYGIYTYATYNERWWWKKRRTSKKEVHQQIDWTTTLINGHVSPGWERVRDEFVQNFRTRGELGAAICVYYKGEKVVDLWGGYADRTTKRPWNEDTVVPIFSSTKGISAIALYMLASKGCIDLQEKVTTYWPEFGIHGKENVTVLELIDHSVGLAGISPPVTLDMLQQQDSQRVLRQHIAGATMEWSPPNQKKGYMAIMLGFYESVLVQLTDKYNRTIGKYLHDDAFTKLGIENEVYIGLPESVPDSRIAKLDGMAGIEPLWPTGSFPNGFMRKLLTQPNSYTGRAFRNPQLSLMPSVLDYDRRDVQSVEIPAANGVATARGVATMYRAVERVINAAGESTNNPLGLNRDLLIDLLSAPAKRGLSNGWIDEVVGIEATMGAGMLLPAPPGIHPTTVDGGGRFICTPGRFSFGTPGAGGSFGFADIDAELAYSYVMNRCGQLIVDDPREFALRDKVYEAVHNLRRGVAANDLSSYRSHLNVPHYLAKRYMKAHPELAPLP